MKKINKLKVVIAMLIVIAIIAVIVVLSFRRTSESQDTVQNNVQSASSQENESQTIEENSAEEASTNLTTEETEPEEVDEVWEWQHDSLENHNIDVAAIEAVHNTFDQYPINAEVIVKDGVIVDEYYKDGYNSESIFTLQSTSKSITSAIFGIAIEQGYIDGVDTPISEYFPQILNYESEYKNQITVWNLLTHTTGLNASDTYNWDEWLASSNWVDYVLERDASYRPGTVFNYFTGNTHLLSAIIQEATGMTTYEYVKENLFDKLDMDSAQCTTDPQGISDGGNGFALDIYDMAKFGQLYLNNGVWEGEQVVPANWVADSTTVQFERSSGSADYGYQWWVRTFGDNAYDAYFAQGHYGQYIFVVPEINLVVAIASHYEGSSSIYWQIMNNIVNACN